MLAVSTVADTVAQRDTSLRHLQNANGTAGPCDTLAVPPPRPALLRLLRPRTIARTIKTVDDLGVVSRDLKRLVKQLEQQAVETDARTTALEGDLRGLRDVV